MNDENAPRPFALTPRQALLMVLYLALAMTAGMLVDRFAWATVVPTGAFMDFKLMAEAWNTIRRHYVDRTALQSAALTYGAISGMVDALGDTGHSEFLTPDMVKQLAVGAKRTT